MRQLEGDLNEAVGTRFAFLDQAFAKVIEGEDVHVHVVRQSAGHFQRAADHCLALWRKEAAPC